MSNAKQYLKSLIDQLVELERMAQNPQINSPEEWPQYKQNIRSKADGIWETINSQFGSNILYSSLVKSAREWYNKIVYYLELFDKRYNAYVNQNKQGSDTRTDEWNTTNTPDSAGDINSLGDFTAWLQGVLNGTAQGVPDNKTQYLDTLLQLLGARQSQQWQRESDDLAWSRTNTNAQYDRLVSLGMSPAAALQAVSGVVGSPTGAASAIAPASGFESAATSAQQLQLGRASLNETIATDHTSAMLAQQELFQRMQQMDLQFGDEQRERKMLELIKGCYTATYTMQAKGIDIPESACATTLTFKLWARDNRDRYRQYQKDIESDYPYYISPEGDVYDSYESWRESAPAIYNAHDIATWKACDELYKEIEVLQHEPLGGLAFERFFLSNAAGRQYHAKETYAQMCMAQERAGLVMSQLQEVETAFESQEFAASLSAELFVMYNNADLDPSIKADIESRLNNSKIVWSPQHGQFGYIRNTTATTSEGDSSSFDAFVPATAWDLLSSGVFGVTLTQKEILNARLELQGLSEASNEFHFRQRMKHIAATDELQEIQDKLNLLTHTKAFNAINSYSGLRLISSTLSTLKMSGLDDMISAAAGAAFGITSLTQKRLERSQRYMMNLDNIRARNGR